MTTRIEIPIPQKELAFEFVDDPESGLLAFKADSLDAHIAAFRAVNQGIDEHFWSQSAVCASLTTKYGEKGAEIAKMAAAVELSEGYLRHMARTYRTFQYLPRDKNLSFSHHKAACRHPRPDEALAVARERGFSKNDLESWISEQSFHRATKATQKAKRAVRNSWREHLLHMDQVIAEDFIKNSPNQEFARRVCGEWRVEISDELKQLEITEHRELIINAIDERAAESIKAIRKLTGIDTNQITWIVGRLVAEGVYEWINRGGKKDNERGEREKILHKVGTPDGSYTIARTENNYAH